MALKNEEDNWVKYTGELTETRGILAQALKGLFKPHQKEPSDYNGKTHLPLPIKLLPGEVRYIYEHCMQVICFLTHYS